MCGALRFGVVTALHAAIGAQRARDACWLFIVLQGLTMACFAFTSSNLGTLAMEHMAPIAGTASSVQGVIGTIGAAIIGFVIGQAFDGTVLPFLLGSAGLRARSASCSIVADRAEAAVRADAGRSSGGRADCGPEIGCRRPAPGLSR